jgi:thiol-disulfide isomerase/thioredoxin
MKLKLFGFIPFLCLMISCSSTAQVKPDQQAQTTTQTQSPAFDTTAPYIKNPHIPNFSMVSAVDGKDITNYTIPTNYKYTCFIIFSPDCSHCEHEAEELNKNADKFKDVLFIWDSYREMENIKKFASKYNLLGHPNIIIGRDPAFTIPTFFRPKMTPFVALYKNGNFVKVWGQGVEVDELLKLISAN